jgi:hypothetical protein
VIPQSFAPDRQPSSWESMESMTRTHIQETLQIVMDWGDHVYHIKNNAVRELLIHNSTTLIF